MRQAIGLVAVVLAVLVLAIPASATTLEATGQAERKGCDHMHPSSEAYNQIRRLIRHHRPEVRSKRVAHWATCLATRAKSREAWRRAGDYRKWRQRYENVWPIRRNELDSWIMARLRVLRGCETRGAVARYGPGADYRWDGHHKGAYQYTVPTWKRAQAWYAAVTGRKVVGWTWSAHVSSPAHQDVVTAFFFPSHVGEWACRA